MTTELGYLAAAATLTLLMRVPWMLNKVSVRGLKYVVGYPEESAPLSGWAKRLWIAHEDAQLSLLTFAPLIIVVHLAGASDQSTAFAAAAYFWARVVHMIVYIMAVPWIKTIAYITGFVAQLWLAWSIFV